VNKEINNKYIPNTPFKANHIDKYVII